MDQILISIQEAKKTSITELLQKLLSSEKGLSDSAAGARLEKYGYNEITEKKAHPFLLLPFAIDNKMLSNVLYFIAPQPASFFCFLLLRNLGGTDQRSGMQRSSVGH